MEYKQSEDSYLYNIDELWDIVTNWEPDIQSIFVKYLMGYGIEEIADIEECSVEKVLRVIERCKRRLAPL